MTHGGRYSAGVTGPDEPPRVGRVTVTTRPGLTTIAVAAPGPWRTWRAGVYAASLNLFAVTAAYAVWEFNARAAGGATALAVIVSLMLAGLLCVTAPALISWTRAVLTGRQFEVTADAVTARTWFATPLGRFAERERTIPRTPADHAVPSGADFLPLVGEAGWAVLLFVGPECETAGEYLLADEVAILTDALNAVVLHPDATAKTRRKTLPTAVRKVLDPRRDTRVTPVPPSTPAPEGATVRVWRDEVGTPHARTPAAEPWWGERWQRGWPPLFLGTVGSVVAVSLIANGLAGRLPLWAQFGLAAVPGFFLTVRPIAAGLWFLFGDVTVSVRDGEGGAVLEVRRHVGPVGASRRLPAGAVWGVWNVRTDGRVKPVAVTRHAVLDLTGDAIRPLTAEHAGRVIAGLLAEHRGEPDAGPGPREPFARGPFGP